MFKRIVSCILTAIISVCALFAPVNVSAEDMVDEEPKYIYNNKMTVFDAIKIKRSLIANDGLYQLEDYEYVRDTLIRKRIGDKTFSNTVSIRFDTEGFSLEKYPDPTVLDSKIVYAGSTFIIPYHVLKKSGFYHAGWDYNGKTYVQGDKFTVPDENVVFTPSCYTYHTLTFYAGDYEDVIEYPYFSVQGAEGFGTELPDSSRFTRAGYKLVGWRCDYDDISYGPVARYTIPDKDVMFTAVWQPSPITLSISANNGVSTDKITETVYCGDEFVFPECTFTNGDKTFLGWRYNGIVYKPGNVLKIPALIPGQSIVIVAKWG
ncbi:MAG: hypothetical protein E7508_03215 [Ruminococcus sp.]|nr:hypothetical protein [Ruminococcus sp.]